MARLRKTNHKQKIAVTNGESERPPNEWIIRQFILKKNPKAINPHWVYWMLAMLWDARRQGKEMDQEFMSNHAHSKREPIMEMQ